MKNLLTVGIATALIASNGITAWQYKSNVNKLDQEITSLTKQNSKLNESLVNKNKLIKQDKTQLNTYSVQVKELKGKNKKLDSQIDKLGAKLKKAHKDKHESPSSGLESKKPSQVYEVSFYTSGYESTQKQKGDNGYGITASGTRATEGRTIAAPKSIPFGTKVYIEGIGVRVVEDRGQAITSGHMDVYVESVSKARELGRQKLNVKILD